MSHVSVCPEEYSHISLVDAHTAQIDVVDIPFLRLREKLFTPTANADMGLSLIHI